MNTRNIIIFIVIITVIGISTYQLYQTPQKPHVIDIAFDYNPGGQRVNIDSVIFDVYSYVEDWDPDRKSFNLLWIEKKIKYDYSEIEVGNQNTVFIIPLFTHSAYWEHGFYEYYKNECDESCLTTELENNNPFFYESSRNTIQILSLLGYDYITDVEVANNPEILKKYDKVIILHNEYVTVEEFEAIINHPKVMYLYPNSLYAEVQYDKKDNVISLVRGHGYPEKSIGNGFDWEFDNTHPYESDIKCESWEFYEIDNGVMLNCYPENIIYNDISLLNAIKDY